MWILSNGWKDIRTHRRMDQGPRFVVVVVVVVVVAVVVVAGLLQVCATAVSLVLLHSRPEQHVPTLFWRFYCCC